MASVTIINNYNFLQGKSKLFEVRFDDIPRSSPKGDRFQWYLIHKNARYDLTVDTIYNNNNNNGLRALRCGNIEVILDVANLLIYIHEYDNSGCCGSSFTEEKYNLI